MYMNIRNQKDALKNLETRIEQLIKDFQGKVAKEASGIGICKSILADEHAHSVDSYSNYTNELLGVSFISDDHVQEIKNENEGLLGVLSGQLPLKELNPRSFTLPCTIGSLNMYALADLGDLHETMIL
ncbi:hypothetical protein Tco_0720259, partial [Tanacetum coccineum]